MAARRETMFMRAYVLITGVIFGLITLAHIWRVFAEGLHLAASPVFILLTAVAAGLCFWAWRLLWPSSRS
jgi:hypothetical protein